MKKTNTATKNIVKKPTQKKCTAKTLGENKTCKSCGSSSKKTVSKAKTVKKSAK